jgi:hypothetical protein
MLWVLLDCIRCRQRGGEVEWRMELTISSRISLMTPSVTRRRPFVTNYVIKHRRSTRGNRKSRPPPSPCRVVNNLYIPLCHLWTLATVMLLSSFLPVLSLLFLSGCLAAQSYYQILGGECLSQHRRRPTLDCHVTGVGSCVSAADN